MTDWLEAVAARGAHVSEFVSPCIPLTVSERDRLVKIARGVRELAEQWAKVADVDSAGDEAEEAWNEAYGNCAAELRKLEDV